MLTMLRLSAVLSTACATLSTISAQTTEIQFNRDIRPILSDNCFKCHGPDAKARKAKLRLDRRDPATAPRKHGRAIVPNDSDKSLIIQRIRHANPKKRMPPMASGKTLTEKERALLEQWIANGANWQAHWSYEPINEAATPNVDLPHPIDRFLRARQDKIGIPVAPETDHRTLVRRLHFDLIGLPPGPEAEGKVDRGWYERLVAELLQSEQHAERLTMYWLDLVRYADSSGIHGDQVIPMSPFRDYVIESFHQNKPFDVFTREQLAGDLLPNATLKQKIASGYNRLNMKTAEGGAQEKEYLAKYAADRVRTTAATWLGATLGCAECHDHKFDPFLTRDFYRFEAFFADLDHKGFYGGANQTGDWGPRIEVPSKEHTTAIAEAEREIAAIEVRMATPTPEIRAAQLTWEARTRAALVESKPPTLGPWRAIGPFTAKSLKVAHDAAFGPERDASPDRIHRRLAWKKQPTWRDGVVNKLTGASCSTYLYRTIDSPIEQSIDLSLGSDDSIKVWLNGKLVLNKYTTRGAKPGQEKPTIALRAGRNEFLMKISNGGGGYGFYFKTSRIGPPTPIVTILNVAHTERTTAQRATLATHFQTISPELAADRRLLAEKKKALLKLEKDVPTTLISKVRMQPRVIRVLPRGNWLDETGEIVAPGVPAFLPQPKPTGRRLTRLDLANWLTSPDNPLTARVFVNRLWKQFFGRGLVATLDDLGSQGAWPRHPELLDWLAAEFRKDWNVRRIIKLIVTSDAYRQSSDATASLIERDPENREFARQGRFRHDAEIVRDQALAVSGLLNRKIGGPSVKPYQPAGYWAQLNFPRRTWKHDTDDSQYRRGLYTHWQRTFLHPSMLAFDAPTREECTAERMRSNTPLQALALLNDPTYVEAARVLAANILRSTHTAFAPRLRFAFGRVLTRAPTANEFATLKKLFAGQRARYAGDLAAARELITVGLAPTDPRLDPIEHAAWTAIARVLLNLHETITRY